jgi:hypothetical protein
MAVAAWNSASDFDREAMGRDGVALARPVRRLVETTSGKARPEILWSIRWLIGWPKPTS